MNLKPRKKVLKMPAIAKKSNCEQQLARARELSKKLLIIRMLPVFRTMNLKKELIELS